MRTLLLLLLPQILCLASSQTFGLPFLHNKIHSVAPLSSQSLFRTINLDRGKGNTLSSRPSLSPHRPHFQPSPELHAPAPAPIPSRQGPSAGPSSTIPRRLRHHHRHRRPVFVIPVPSAPGGCSQTCVDPLTSTPFGSPCGCVFPMKIRLLLDVSLYAVFPVINELEIEVAAGTYLLQSQVIIIGASADSQSQEKTTVDLKLVPLGEKFDNTTAMLTYERFRQKKVPLNKTLFGNYEVIYINYPGFPSSQSTGGFAGSGPSGSAGITEFPVTANFVKKGEKINPGTIFIIALSGVVLLVVCIGAVAVLLKWRAGMSSNVIGPVFTPSFNKRHGIGSTLSSSMESSTSMSLISTMPTSVLSVKTFTLSELEKATDKFNLQRVLGEGGFGRVYHGILEDGTDVAVKVLTRDNHDGDREFIAEIEMLSRLHHRNLVKLIGMCFEEHIRCLVYELIPNGSIESHLHGTDKRKGHLDWDARLKIALGAARGLAYLHEDSNPRVIHRDFKGSNVLLENDFTPKVSDFGLAREATEGSHYISTRVMGTFGYVAPEYAMTGHLLVKSDVYSYGVVLLELLSGRKPVDMSQPPGEENLVTWARPLLGSREGLEQLVDPSLNPGSYDFDDMAKVASIASMCVHTEVTHRPFMGEVVQALKLLYNDAADDTCKESSARDSDFKGDLMQSDSSWGNAGGITMEYYSSGSLEEMENRSLPAASGLVLYGNRSGPLRTIKSKRAFYRLKGSMSDHGGLRDVSALEASF
ncbi:receptor-like serine/threonine-protein kinase ALE2 [Impatiens glandulifera]|uniref:receptor-like serine/threonine-protein kinase ALE2 n=1 Tax=Impatiens glandulifera TaxID=253017 RepID=UPI001FB16654|nr:receptor-like serine/threonine-protein kinase ALE2 [Impatiens glandulifera]